MPALAALRSRRLRARGGTRRHLLAALFALAAMLLCGSAMHASGGHGSGHAPAAEPDEAIGIHAQLPSSLTAAASVHSAHAPAAASASAAVATAAAASVPDPGGQPERLATAAHSTVLEMACMLVLLTAVALLLPPVAAGLRPRPLDALLSRIAPVSALAARSTPTLQELSISRT